MTFHPRSHILKTRHRAAFTLNEVLIALGILALGSVAVASLFPTAAFLQKQAVKETMRQNHIRSTDALLEGVGLENLALLEFIELVEDGNGPAAAARTAITDPAYDVFALSEVDLEISSSYDTPAVIPAIGGADQPDMTFNTTVTTLMPAPVDDSDSYVYDPPTAASSNHYEASLKAPRPYIGPTDLGPGNTDNTDDYINREVYWVPFVRAGLEASELYPDWSVYIFVLQPDSQLRNTFTYANANYPATFNGLICANPLDADYFPKVFRVPINNWNSATPQIAITSINLYGYVKPGDKVLGDNGKIYRVSQVQANGGTSTAILNEEGLYAPLNERDLGAIWVAPAAAATNAIAFNQNSPIADIRLLSNTVVRTSDY